MSSSNFHVAIIGAGLSGLALALALHKQNISCTLYEGRDAPLNNGGGLMLTPNGLKILDAIGIYDSLLDHAYAFDSAYVQHGPSGKIIEIILYGDVKAYGKPALRAYRYAVLEQLLKKAREQGIPIHFNRNFSHVLSETDEEVTWEFADGSKSSASILVGADGLNSTVRKYIAPEVKPVFGGTVALVAAVPTAQLGLPESDLKNLNDANNKHPLPGGVVVPQLGALVAAPQTKNGDEVMITVMRSIPEEPDHWSSVDNDKDLLRAMFRENVDKFPEVAQNAVSDLPDQGLRIWPFYQIPHLDCWTSANSECDGKGRAVILGDSAHACPPSSGQGANMAFEDVYMFAGVLGRLGEDLSLGRLQKGLHGWQLFRQDRIEVVLRLNKIMEILRLPAAKQATDAETVKASMNEEFHTLFKIDYAEAVDECLKKGGVE